MEVPICALRGCWSFAGSAARPTSDSRLCLLFARKTGELCCLLGEKQGRRWVT